MKNTIGLIAPHEPEVLALLTQQRITWQQARRQAIRLLLAGTTATAVVAALQERFGFWPAMAGRLVRQAQSLLHPQSLARGHYLDYLAGCDDPALTADEADFYRTLPDAGADVLIGVDFRAPEVDGAGDFLSLVWQAKANQFHLSLPMANPGGEPGRLSGVPVLFADTEADELRRLSQGQGDVQPVKLPSQELVWWQGQPHLVVGFDPDELAAYGAFSQPSRSTMVTAAVAAALTVQTALPVGAAYATTPGQMIVASVNSPVVKVLDASTGRQLDGVRLVAPDGKVLARSDDSGTLLLPKDYGRYNLFNLVKDGYQFMLLEASQLTPHNLLRVEMTPVSAQGTATSRPVAAASRTAAKVASPPPLPGKRPSTPAQATAKPTAQQASRPPAAPSKLAQAMKATASPSALPTAKATTQAPVQQPVAKATTQAPLQQPVASAATAPKQAAKAAQAPVRTEQVVRTVAPTKPSTMAAPMAQVAQTPRSTTAGTYVVRRGDNLWTIAQRQLGDGSRWLAIYQANRDTLRSPERIWPGQQLVIPAADVTVARVQIQVKPGDTLSKIAQARLGNAGRWNEIYELNRSVLRSPRWIFPGQVLWVPSR